MVRIACRNCDRGGQYRRSSLSALYGENVALSDVLRLLARDCPKRSGIGNEACGVYFTDLIERIGKPKARRS